MDALPARCDAVVVGAGIVGLATARELLLRRPGSSVVVLEREPRIASHQTSHNSGVIHAGVYYEPGSLKARLCVDGARELYEYCEQRGVAHRRCGKLIVATHDDELARLEELERRAGANGVRARRLTASELADVEPACRGVSALHVADTGVVDFEQVAAALAGEVRERGGQVVTGADVLAARPHGDAVLVRIAHGVAGRAPHRDGDAAGATTSSARDGSSPAPARGPIASRSRRAPRRTRASCRSAAPTRRCGRSAPASCAR